MGKPPSAVPHSLRSTLISLCGVDALVLLESSVLSTRHLMCA